MADLDAGQQWGRQSLDRVNPHFRCLSNWQGAVAAKADTGAAQGDTFTGAGCRGRYMTVFDPAMQRSFVGTDGKRIHRRTLVRETRNDIVKQTPLEDCRSVRMNSDPREQIPASSSENAHCGELTQPVKFW